MKVNFALRRVFSRLIIIIGKISLVSSIFEEIIKNSLTRYSIVQHSNSSLKFSIPNGINRFRVETFSSKEPETLDWIDTFPVGSVLWDIGANVGLYSCYAAVSRQCRVFAFEPSVFNLEVLARNINLNMVQSLITILPIAVSSKSQINSFNMSSTEWGGALSSFGESFGFDGKTLLKKFEYSTIGISMDELIEFPGIEFPDYLKLDVDGIEHLILSGGTKVLSAIKGVLVEVNVGFEKQADDVSLFLVNAGLHKIEIHQWKGVKNTPFSDSYNLVWAR